MFKMEELLHSSRFRLSVWSTLRGTLAIRAKTWVCLNEISQNKHHRAVYVPENEIQTEVKQF